MSKNVPVTSLVAPVSITTQQNGLPDRESLAKVHRGLAREYTDLASLAEETADQQGRGTTHYTEWMEAASKFRHLASVHRAAFD